VAGSPLNKGVNVCHGKKSYNFLGHHELFPNEIILNVKILNPKNGENPKHKNPEKELS
jgi:hypothetical protein